MAKPWLTPALKANLGRIVIRPRNKAPGKVTRVVILSMKSAAVSYTHLDVYKRQTFRVAMLARAVFLTLEALVETKNHFA